MVIKVGHGWHDGMESFLVDEKPVTLVGSNADPRGRSVAEFTRAGDWALTTALYFDVLDAGGRPATGAIDLWAPETVLIVRSIETRAFARYRLDAAPTNEGPGQWRKLVSLTYIDGDGIIADDEDLAVEWNRAGAAGPILGIPLVFDGSGITDIDPGAGKVRPNHATNPTVLFVSKTDASGGNIAASLATLGTSTGPVKGQMRFQPSDGGNTFMDYDVTGLTDAAGYVKLAVVLRSGVVATNGQALTLGATRIPDKGTDGTGTGDVIGPSSATDLRVAVFDGDGKHIKDGGKTIAELVPAGYGDLLMSVSLLALQVADNSNVALFLGSSGNRVADSFDALTYVDVAGATSLDTGTAGLLKPTAVAGTTTASQALNADVNNGGFTSRNIFGAATPRWRFKTLNNKNVELHERSRLTG